MNVLQDCKDELARLGRAINAVLLNSGQACQCDSKPSETTVQNTSTCDCGQDACQIGADPGACKPRNHVTIEQV
jgi:hypothetical protein